MKPITKILEFVIAAIGVITKTAKGRRNMKREDLKFRYIIPLDEKNERGETGFLYDKARLAERFENGGLAYKDFVCGEALVLDAAKRTGDVAFLNDMALDAFTFPSDVTETEQGIALYVVKFRLGENANEDEIQRGIIDFFAGKNIVKAEGLEKHFGFPY